MARTAATAPRLRRRERKNITSGTAHVNATFNNTMITITDAQGNTIAWSSSGSQGFKGSRKSTPYAAQVAAEDAGRKAMEHGMRTIEIEVKGPGSGRESALRALQAVGFAVTSIRDVTPILLHISMALVRPMPWMYVNPIGTRFWLGIFTPAMRATCASPQKTKWGGFCSSQGQALYGSALLRQSRLRFRPSPSALR